MFIKLTHYTFFGSLAPVPDAVGYEDAAFFRQLFKRHAGLSPREYR